MSNQTLARTKKGCPRCGGPVLKAIFAGLPLKACEDEGCCVTWGPGSFLMNHFSNGGGWALLVYTGSYWPALWYWLRHG